MHSQQWEAIGPDDFNIASYEKADSPAMVSDSQNNLYVVFVDYEQNSKATVRKYDGKKWSSVGIRGFSESFVSITDIAIDRYDRLYVIYKDNNYNGKATVKMFNGTDWEDVGPPGFSSGSISSVAAINIGSDDRPYIAYDIGGSGLIVQYFNGTDWQNVGTPGFYSNIPFSLKLVLDSNVTPFVSFKEGSNSGVSHVMSYDGNTWAEVTDMGLGNVYDIDLSVTKSDTLYVAYTGQGGGDKITVKKLKGTDWVGVGNEGFTEGASEYISLTFDDQETPYVAYEYNNSLLVKKFNGAEWEDIGVGSASNGIPNYISLVISTDQKLHLMYREQNYNHKVLVRGFDGTEWLDEGTPGISNGNVYDIAMALNPSGTPYIAFNDYNNSGKVSVKKYNGANWEFVGDTVFSNDNVRIIDLAVNSNDTPYVAYIESYYSITVKKFNGTDWEDVGSTEVSGGSINYLTLVIASDDTPYISYRRNSNAGVKKFNGSTWENIGTPGFTENDPFYLHLGLDNNDTPYVVYNDNGKTSVKKFNGTDWENVGTPQFSSTSSVRNTSIVFDASNTPFVAYDIDYGPNDIVEVRRFNGTNWVQLGAVTEPNSAGYNYTSIALDGAGTPYVIFRDASKNGKAVVKRYNGNSWNEVGSADGNSSGVVSYTDLAFDSNGNLYAVYGSPEVYVKKVDGANLVYNQIYGTFHYDFNQNGCDDSDETVEYIRITIDNGTVQYSTFTNIEGKYYLLFPEEGAFTVTLNYDSNLFQADTEQYNFNFTGFGNSAQADFCLEPMGSFNDLSVIVYNVGSRLRPGFESEFEMLVSNNGNTLRDGSMELDFDSSMIDFYSEPDPPDTIINNTLVYGFLSLKPYQKRRKRIRVKVKAPPGANDGDQLPLGPIVLPSNDDNNPDDNNPGPFYFPIRNSWDPNNTTVLEGDQISIDEASNYLNYVIKFQNTGSAEAINVRVENTLMDKLDWSSFQLLRLSHKGRVVIKNGNEVSFYFDDIYLADSTSNEPQSHGYIVYKIKPKPDVEIGDVLTNNANIFFDYNPAVPTNTATTEIVSTLSIADNELSNFKVYPVPSTNFLTIQSTTNIKQIKIYNYLGQLSLTHDPDSGLTQMDINLSALKPGIYFLKVESENGAVGTKKIIKM